MTAPAIRLFLIRHGLSEANLDKAVNLRVPDHAVQLAEQGHAQANAAGAALAQYLRDHPVPGEVGLPTRDLPPGMEWSVQPRRARMLVSPYRRTRETADGLTAGLDKAVSFDRREASELREISFGLFDGLEDHEIPDHYPREHAHYQKHKAFEGEFFAPMPLGESRVQVMDRVKTVFGTIQRDADPSRETPILDFFIVSHGVTIRAFETAWMHKPWEFYGTLRNPANCSIKLISGGPGQGYAVSTIFDGFRTERATHQAAREERGVNGVEHEGA
jgi:broad specificity phosphatase PhoE